MLQFSKLKTAFIFYEGVCREVNDLVELERNYYLPIGTVERDNLNLS